MYVCIYIYIYIYIYICVCIYIGLRVNPMHVNIYRIKYISGHSSRRNARPRVGRKVHSCV